MPPVCYAPLTKTQVFIREKYSTRPAFEPPAYEPRANLGFKQILIHLILIFFRFRARLESMNEDYNFFFSVHRFLNLLGKLLNDWIDFHFSNSGQFTFIDFFNLCFLPFVPSFLRPFLRLSVFAYLCRVCVYCWILFVSVILPFIC